LESPEEGTIVMVDEAIKYRRQLGQAAAVIEIAEFEIIDSEVHWPFQPKILGVRSAGCKSSWSQWRVTCPRHRPGRRRKRDRWERFASQSESPSIPPPRF